MQRLDERDAPSALTKNEMWTAIQPPSNDSIQFSGLLSTPSQVFPVADRSQDDPQGYKDTYHIALVGDSPDISDSEWTNSQDDNSTDDQHQSSSVGHPGYWESFIPVWGSGREAIADYQEGKYGEAALNAALAASDLFVYGTFAKGIAKGGIKLGSHTWPATRKWMGKQGLLEKGQHGHHWLIPRNGWGKPVPDIIKNQPWNIMGMPSQAFHNQVHGVGPNAFGLARRLWYGTPTWAKVHAASTVGHVTQPYWDSNGGYADSPD